MKPVTHLRDLPPIDPDGFYTFRAFEPVICPSHDRRAQDRGAQHGSGDRRREPRPCRRLLTIVGPGTVVRVRVAPVRIASMAPGRVDVIPCECERKIEKRTYSVREWLALTGKGAA